MIHQSPCGTRWYRIENVDHAHVLATTFRSALADAISQSTQQDPQALWVFGVRDGRPVAAGLLRTTSRAPILGIEHEGAILIGYANSNPNAYAAEAMRDLGRAFQFDPLRVYPHAGRVAPVTWESLPVMPANRYGLPDSVAVPPVHRPPPVTIDVAPPARAPAPPPPAVVVQAPTAPTETPVAPEPSAEAAASPKKRRKGPDPDAFVEFSI